MEKPKHQFDLCERTSVFGERIIDFVKTLSVNTITKPLISQLIRSATSIGANYMEANEASTNKDFLHKISISRKEAKETIYWLRMILRVLPQSKDEIEPLDREAHELVLIFAAIIRKSNA